MFDTLFSRLKNIQEGYGAAIGVADGIFNSLKGREFKILPELTKFQSELMIALKNEKDILKDEVTKIVNQKGLSEVRIQILLPFFPQTQKEVVLDLMKDLMKKETELERALMRNQQFLSVLVSTQKAIVDSAISINESHNNSNQIFLNRKF